MPKFNGAELAEYELKLSQYEGEDKIVSSHDLAKELETNPVPQIEVGIPALDKLLNGVEGGELIVVTGPSDEGKSTLLMTISANLADQKIDSAWFTLEITPKQLLTKLLKHGAALPLFYIPRKNLDNTIKWLEERIMEARVKYNVKAIFIDHLHQIFSLAQMSQPNISLEIGDLVAKIKDIALRENIPIFLVAHCKDDSVNPLREPRKEDLRDSGMVVRTADTVIAVWRVKTNSEEARKNRRPNDLTPHDNWAKVRVLKNRREGVYGTLYMLHNQHYLQEINIDDNGYNDLQ